MIERMLMEYLVNSLWQAPLLALTAWLVLRAGRPGPRAQHGVWVAALALMVAMPLLSLRSADEDAAALRVAAPVSSQGSNSTQAARLRPGQPALVRSDSAPAAAESPRTAELNAALENTALGNAAPTDVVPQASGHRGDAPSGGGQSAAGRLRMRELRLSAAATRVVVELYLAVVAFAMMRLLWSWMVARRMVAEAVPAQVTATESALLDACCERLGVLRPRVLVSARTSSPLVVGVVRPALLLPESFAERGEETEENTSRGVGFGTEYSARELEAVWWHELAHVRRRDYLANLLLRLWALPAAYHPATYAVERRVRRTREMVCDRIAADAMRSPVGYARCLLGLAQRMQAGCAIEQMQAVGLGLDLFGGGVLEERVIELIETKATVSGRMRLLRLAGSLAMALAVVCAAAMFHVTPTMAQAEVTAARVDRVGPPPASESKTAVQLTLVAELAEALPKERVAPIAAPNVELQTAAPQSGIREAAVFHVEPTMTMAQAPPQTAQPAEPQIRLKVRFVSYDRTLARQLGVDLFSLGAANSIGSVTTQRLSPPSSTCIPGTPGAPGAVASPASATASDPLDLFIFRPDLNLGATIEALQTQRVVQVLSEPDLLTANGKEGSFLAGGQYPFPVALGANGTCAITIEFREFGVRLNLIPTITPRGSIRLQVAPEVSSLDFANGATTSGFTVPGLDVRKVKAEVELSQGQSFAIGGLLDSRSAGNFSKMPFRGDIPVLAKFFQSVNTSKTDTELIAIVTPEIVQPIPVGAVPVPSGTMAESVISKPNPVYPVDAKAARVQGAVVLDAVISKEGTVERLDVVSGPEMLQASAVKAVKNWKYKPYLVDGSAVEVETTITVNYTFGW